MAAIGKDPLDPLPGYAGAVGVGDRVVFSRAAGLADLGGRSATTQTRYRIFSTSRSIGAVAAVMLVESGQLKLDTPIAAYLPGLPAHLGVVTVRQLLAHRSGVRHYRDGEWDRVSSSHCQGPSEALHAFIGDPLQFEPGSGYQYTTFGYVLLSAVLEAASGQPFDVLARKRVFEPAGMIATAIEGRPVPGHELAVFYDRGANGADGNGQQPPYGYGFFPGDRVLTTLGVPLEDYVPAWWHGGNGRGGYSVLIIYPEQRAAAAITTNVKATARLVRATHALALPFLRGWVDISAMTFG